MQGCYSFREGEGNFFHLLGMSQLMGSNHLKPFVSVQGSEKWMWHVVFLQIFTACFFYENKRSLANFAKLRQHLFFLAKHVWIERNWRFEPDQARFDERHGNMKML